MTTRPKKMLVHRYENGKWTSHEYPSVRQMQRSLRAEGISFGQNSSVALGSNSLVLIRNGTVFEIEEAVDNGQDLEFLDKTYEPVKTWAMNHGTTVRKARYAYKTGRLEGMTVGRRNYLFLRKQ